MIPNFARFALLLLIVAVLAVWLPELHRLLFIESNPIPVKWAVSQMGFGELNLRLPMTELSEQYREPLRQALIACGAL